MLYTLLQNFRFVSKILEKFHTMFFVAF